MSCCNYTGIILNMWHLSLLASFSLRQINNHCPSIGHQTDASCHDLLIIRAKDDIIDVVKAVHVYIPNDVPETTKGFLLMKNFWLSLTWFRLCKSFDWLLVFWWHKHDKEIWRNREPMDICCIFLVVLALNLLWILYRKKSYICNLFFVAEIAKNKRKNNIITRFPFCGQIFI